MVRRPQLARAFIYATGQSPGEAAALLAEYERREREGPDFMRQRPGSVIAEAPLVTLDRNERVRLIWKFRMLTRRSWVTKDAGKHRGIITRTAESVFGALMYLTEKYGRVFPSLEGLAHLAMCCKQSVVTALDDLERLGFFTRILHSITSSARARSVGGISRPSILAVSALMTSSNLLACTTGRSAGFAPLRMRPV